jgi:hypothetical protein
MKRLILVLSIAASIFCTQTGLAEVNPLRLMSNDLKRLRAEVILVVDVTNSIDDPSGSGCTGDYPGDIDFCGDGSCTGTEDLNGCPADCAKASGAAAATRYPGFKDNCKSPNTESRLTMLKRAMRWVLPKFRGAATFALVTYANHTGYFTYSTTTAAPAAEYATIFLSEAEMRYGGWTAAGYPWDTILDRPEPAFKANGVTYTLVDLAAAADGSDDLTLGAGINSLYRREDAAGNPYYKRFDWSDRIYHDGTYEWHYVGSYYSFMQPTITTTTFSTTEYLGPRYVDTMGDSFVYHKFFVNNPQTPFTEVGQTAKLFMPLRVSNYQFHHNHQMATMMNRLNDPWNGGLATDHTSQNAPARQAIAMARQHFADRINGTGPFVSEGPDGLGNCRNRFVVVLSDGKYSPSTATYDPRPEVKDLYDDYPSNPIKTYVIGSILGGSSKPLILDAMADFGDNGTLDSSESALMANDEGELASVLYTTLLNALAGDFTTSSPGVTTSSVGGPSASIDNTVLLPSAAFPGWQGHLRAARIDKNPPEEIWDAGQRLASTTFFTRTFFTGLSNTNSGDPIRVFNNNGAGDINVNLNGAAPFTDGVGIKGVWPGTAPTPDANLKAFVQWLAGKNRDWKLGTIVNTVPATVGRPPRMSQAPGHDAFEALHVGREELIYTTSNEGGVHAFKSETGDEAFVYVPPAALPQLYEIWTRGGQEEDPDEFIWAIANSVRVADVPDGLGIDASNWTTQLVVTLGKGGEAMTVLDISSPSDCTSDPCVLNDPPFTIITDSSALGPAVTGRIGETWSIPTIFYADGASGYKGVAAFGSGYEGSIGGDNEYYVYMPNLWTVDDLEHDHLTPTSPLVDYSVFADTVAVIDPATMKAVATYQSDLMGRITRYDDGDAATPSTPNPLFDVTSSHPIYYSPAAFYHDSSRVTLAFASGSYYEEGSGGINWMTDPSYTSQLYMRSEMAGTPNGLDTITCDIDSLCSCIPNLPSPCASPSAAAVPVMSPMILQDSAIPDKLHVYFIYYDPPPQHPANCTQIIGDSWIIELTTDAAAGLTLERAKRYKETYISGFMVVGGGTDIALIKSGIGVGAKATTETLSGSPIPSAALPATVELWREMR